MPAPVAVGNGEWEAWQDERVSPGHQRTTDLALPDWLQDLRTGLAVRSQFVVSGNVRDLFPISRASEQQFLPADKALWRLLKAQGYTCMLRYDPVDGIRLHTECDRDRLAELQKRGVDLRAPPRDLKTLADQLRLVTSDRRAPVAFLLDYASQICHRVNELDSAERDFFITCDKIAHGAVPLRAEGRPSHLPYNPIIWFVDRPTDLPDWLMIGNEAVRPLTANLPNLEERFALALRAAHAFHDVASLSTEERKRGLEQLALETDGMSLRSLLAITELARAERIGLRRVSDAIRAFRIGTPANPWRSRVMRARIANGEKLLKERVKGQDHAVRLALDILIRSVVGLSGSQSSSRHGRPRGVMFFAGPTGVGKTELAKAITELLFGDEAAYHRFDMSEFSAKNSESRLIGAPPGYTGHEQGGELVNAARSRPFSVFLFDEIEKAHPLILDKFLQIIDEGRLTDGRGETVHFSESLIIFTSNLGIFGDDSAMNMSLNILPSDTYEEIEEKVVGAIRKHFRFKLRRPELLNRIGRNIVVFEFIRAHSSILILRNMLRKVAASVHEEHGVELTFTESAMAQIEELCTFDLFDGGRGIGNRLETIVINPLARLLFEMGPRLAGRVQITRVEERDGEYQLHASRRPGSRATAAG